MINKRKPRRKSKSKWIIRILVAFIICMVIALVLLVAVAYKLGESSLRSEVITLAPIVDVSESDKEIIEKAKATVANKDVNESNDISTEEVQEESVGQTDEQLDGWMVYNNTAYKYNEDTMNFLLMGIDSKGTMSSQEDFSYEGPGQADAIFLVSLNTKDKKLSIIGIPRNSMVELEIYNEQKQCTGTIYNQICLQYAYAGGSVLGLAKMKESVSDLLYQLPIHGACAINMDAIGVIVDMLGGIEVTVPEDLTSLNPTYVKGSKLTLNKDNAWLYLKYRDTSVLGSPTTRLARQKEFMKAAINIAISKVKSNPTIVSDIYKAVLPYMNTDISLNEAVYLATQLVGYSISNDSFYQLVGYDKKVEYTKENGQKSFFDDYYLDEDSIKDIFTKVFYTEVVVDDN